MEGTGWGRGGRRGGRVEKKVCKDESEGGTGFCDKDRVPISFTIKCYSSHSLHRGRQSATRSVSCVILNTSDHGGSI